MQAGYRLKPTPDKENPFKRVDRQRQGRTRLNGFWCTRRRIHSAACITAALILCVLLVPLPAHADAPDPRFGITETFVNPTAATEAGAGYTRIILRWDVIQPAGPDDWKPANVPDPFIEGDLAAGRQVVGLLIGTPLWACDQSRGPEACQDSRAVPDMNHWAAFVRRMAQQYRGRISHWVIWNEPDVWDMTVPGSTWAGSVEDYARLLKTAYLAIKDVDPAQEVLMAGQTYFWDWAHGRRRYLDRLLDVIAADPECAGARLLLRRDPLSPLLQPEPDPRRAGRGAGGAQASMESTGKELWINETNAPPSDDAQEPPWSKPRFRITQAEQAAFVLQEFSLAFAAGASRVAVLQAAQQRRPSRSRSSLTVCCAPTIPRGRRWPRIGWQRLTCASSERLRWSAKATWSR